MHLSDKGWCSNGTRSATTEKLKAWIPYPQGRCLSQALLCTNLSRQVLSGVIYALVAEGYFLSGIPAPRLERSESAQSYSDRTPGAVSALGSLTTKSVGCLLS